jgi:ADP-heptose:LPS heptosyltransferase
MTAILKKIKIKKSERINWDYFKQSLELPRLFFAGFLKNKKVKDPKKILIINTSLIGDILVSLPAISSYIKKHKNAKIDLLVSSPMKSIAEKVRGVNKVYSSKSISTRKHEKSLSDLEYEELVNNNYDLILAIRLSGDAHKILKKLKSKSVKSSFFTYANYLLYLSDKRSKDYSIKQCREFFFEAFGEKIKKIKFEEIFGFSKEDYEKIRNNPLMAGKTKKIIIHTGSTWAFKLWNNEGWIEVLKSLNNLGNFKFIFVGTTEKEKQDFDYIQNKLNFKIHSAINRLNLAELALLMRLSDYFIGIDSGPRNLAHIAELRSICLLGPGAKMFMPLDKKDIVIDKSDCKCSCLFCFKSEGCIQKITPEEIINAFKKIYYSR